MSEADLRRMVTIAKRVERQAAALAKSRAELRVAVRHAHASESVSEIARRLGVSRSRVYELLD